MNLKNKDMKTRETILSVLGALILFFGGMFMTEIKLFILTHYPILIMCLGVFLLLLAIVSIFIRYVFKEESKTLSERINIIKDLAENNEKTYRELMFNNNFSVDVYGLIIRKILIPKLSDEEIFSIKSNINSKVNSFAKHGKRDEAYQQAVVAGWEEYLNLSYNVNTPDYNNPPTTP